MSFYTTVHGVVLLKDKLTSLKRGFDLTSISFYKRPIDLLHPSVNFVC